MTKDQAMLMRRMIIHYETPRCPNSERERAENLRAVRMLILMGCLDYAMIELSDRLDEAGLMVRKVKYNVNKAAACVSAIHSDISALIKGDSKVSMRAFHDIRDRNWWSIDDHVCLGGVDGAYSVVMALCRLIEACNASISTRYNYQKVGNLKHVKDLLSVICAEDKEIDVIVDKAVVVK